LPEFPPPLATPRCEEVAMKIEILDETADTIFAIAMAAGIGLGTANLAIQVAKERAVLDAARNVHENVTTTTVEAPPLRLNLPQESGTDATMGF
jgi:hypothetical protein